MRLRILVLALFVLAASHRALADQIDMFAAESRIEYGADVFYVGHSFYLVEINGSESAPYVFDEVTFVVYGGDMTGQSVQTDPSGAPVSSRYSYGGGEMIMDVRLLHQITGEVVLGQLTAPVKPFDLVAYEYPDSVLGDNDVVEIFLEFGPGLLTKSMAKALNISRHVPSGFVWDPFLVFGTGDPSSERREAREGAPEVTLDVVPEPAVLVLFGLSAAAFASRRRLNAVKAATRLHLGPACVWPCRKPGSDSSVNR
jgi:hypothetical protein